METLIREHGPLGLLATAMIFTGGFINKNSTQDAISKSWCNNNVSMTTLKPPFTNQLPQGLEESVIVLSVIVPMLPLFLNHFSDVNLEMFKTHVLGQSSSFGLSELMRHYTVMPEPMFLSRCNISNQECLLKTLQSNFTVLSPNQTNSLCNRNFTSKINQELFDSLHHFPDPLCAILGSSLTTIVCYLFFWHRLDKDKKSLFETASWKQMLMIIAQCLILFLVVFYCFYLYKKMDHVQIYGVLLGAFVQFCVTFSLMKDS